MYVNGLWVDKLTWNGSHMIVDKSEERLTPEDEQWEAFVSDKWKTFRQAHNRCPASIEGDCQLSLKRIDPCDGKRAKFIKCFNLDDTMKVMLT